MDLDPGLRAFVERATLLMGEDVRALSLARLRRAYLELCRAYDGPRPEGLQVSDRALVEGGREIGLRIYRPGPTAPLAPILFCHGGGWIMGNLDSHDSLAAELAVRTGAVVIAVDYRLAPAHPHPAALDDVDAVLRALTVDPAGFGLDGGPPVLCGDSAGGNLAAALALRSRARGGPALAGQALLYPVLAPPPVDDPARDDIRYYFDRYIGATTADPNSAPLLATDLSGLPPAFTLTAEHDPLRAEGLAYARRLEAAGVTVTGHDGAGLIHGCLRVWRQSPPTARALDAVVAALALMLAR
jgi:acetyl esterase